MATFPNGCSWGDDFLIRASRDLEVLKFGLQKLIAYIDIETKWLYT